MHILGEEIGIGLASAHRAKEPGRAGSSECPALSDGVVGMGRATETQVDLEPSQPVSSRPQGPGLKSPLVNYLG